MSYISQGTRSLMVNSPNTLVSLLDHIATLPVCFPWLFLTLKGIELDRGGPISVMTLFTNSKDTVYHIDVQHLGTSVFTIVNESRISLKSILETSTVLKVIFDVRKVSDALFRHYNISVNGVKDIRLMELNTRLGSKDLDVSLAECILKDSVLTAPMKEQWERTKRHIARLVDLKKGGQSDVINERPLRSEVVQYCAQEIRLMAGLYHVYDTKLRSSTQVQIEMSAQDPVKLSKENHGGSLDISWGSRSNEQTLNGWIEDEGIEQDPLGYFDESLDEDYKKEMLLRGYIE